MAQPSRLLLQPPRQLVLDNGPWSCEAFSAAFDQPLATALMRLDGWAKKGALEVHTAVGGLVTDERFVAGQVNELAGLELLAEFSVQVLGIVEADAEGDDGADIAKDGLSHRGGELGNVLMAQSEAEPVFPRLGEDGCEGLGREVLELIHKEIEVTTFLLGLAIAGHSGELELRDEQRADEVGFVVADLAFGEVGDEDAPLIHDKGNAHFAAHLADNVAQGRGEEQLTDLVLDRGDGLALEAGIPAFVFVLPEVSEERIVHLLDHPTAVDRVGEQAIHTEQGGVGAMRQRGHSVVKDVFHPRPPGVRPEVLEGSHDARGNEMPFLRGGLSEQIQPDGEIAVAGVKIDGLLRPVGWDVVEQLLRQIAMRVDETNAMALQDELEDEIAQQSGLSRARLANDIGMVTRIRHLKTERRFAAAPRLPHADVKVIVAHASQASRRSMN